MRRSPTGPARRESGRARGGRPVGRPVSVRPHLRGLWLSSGEDGPRLVAIVVRLASLSTSTRSQSSPATSCAHSVLGCREQYRHVQGRR